MQTVTRLTHKFQPTHYQLFLDIDKAHKTFSGTVTINGVSFVDDTFRVHVKDLTIDTVVLNGHEAQYAMKENDELELGYDGLLAGKQVVVIGFHGELTDQMHGMYPCYFDHDGEKKQLIATQFESHHAREVFPCVDEPEAKATFDVTLATEQGVTVLGNMPVKQQAVENRKLVTTFETSPKMSSYLLAWVYGELHKKSATTKRGIEVNVWATVAQKVESLDFALDFATKTIDYYEEYFGINYPLPKSDHVALPDFTSGAMENWGLITYREVALLADPQTATVDSKHYVAMVVGHELSHQWFGNLVTMKWWDNLWLNESFANLIENLPIHSMHPDWGIWMDYASTWSLMALRRDAIEGVQPVQVDVHHPDEIASLFDGAIVYGKGGRLIGMLREYVGEKDFRKGLKAYFTKFQYNNTTGDDLWDCLEAASGKPIRDFMNQWVLRPGYPVVHVSPTGLEQEQFFIGEHTPTDTLWPIPLGAEPSSGLPHLFDQKRLEVPIRQDVRLNIGNWSHFVTNYAQDHFDHLLHTIQSYGPLDRLQLINERVLLTRSNHVPNASLVDILLTATEETNESVWSILLMALGELKKFVEFDTEPRENLKKLARKVAATQYDRLGWQPVANEAENDTKLRPIILALMLYGDDNDTLAEAATRYQGADAIDSLNPELRGVILAAHVKAGIDQAEFDALLTAYVRSTSPTVQDDIIGALAATKNPDQITQLLAHITESDVVRPQDAAHWYVYLVRSRHAKSASWQWLQDNWQWVKKTYGGDKSYDDFVRYSAGALSTPEQLAEYIAFFTPLKSEVALQRVIELGISEIRARVGLIEQQHTAVHERLRNL